MAQTVDLTRMLTTFKTRYRDYVSKDIDERRRSRFGNRFDDLIDLISRDHLSQLSMNEATFIYENLRTGSAKSRKRTLPRFLENDISDVRESFTYLLYGEDNPHERFTKVVVGEKKLRGVREDLASTLLHFLKPERYGIWNKAAKDGMNKLNIAPRKIPGESIGLGYERVNELLRSISAIHGFSQLDIIDWFIASVAQEELQLIYSIDKRRRKQDRRGKAVPPKKEGPPERYVSQSSVLRRDPNVIRRVKDAESWTCQVCGETIALPDGERYYCEVHHIRPLGGEHNGMDEERNTLSLCPNHHAETENGLFYIDPVTREIVYFNSENKYRGLDLRQNQNSKTKFYHEIDADVLRYHRDRLCLWIT